MNHLNPLFAIIAVIMVCNSKVINVLKTKKLIFKFNYIFIYIKYVLNILFKK